MYSKKEIKWALENYHEIYCKETLTGISYEGERVDCTIDPSECSYDLIRKIDLDTAIQKLPIKLWETIFFYYKIKPAKNLLMEDICNRIGISQRQFYRRKSKAINKLVEILN